LPKLLLLLLLLLLPMATAAAACGLLRNNPAKPGKHIRDGVSGLKQGDAGGEVKPCCGNCARNRAAAAAASVGAGGIAMSDGVLTANCPCALAANGGVSGTEL